MKYNEHDWVEVTDGNDKGRKGFIVKRWNEAGVDLYEVYFRDGKGRGSIYGIAERALKPTTPNRARSTNAVVQNALNKAARNASGHKVKVTIKSITDKGLQTFEKVMDVDKLEAWMRAANIAGQYQSVIKQLATMGITSVPITEPCLISIEDM